ncbi:MAG: sigma-70 family RNA polymerase sigma factor [Planctomycetia bacterium]|nr:sigma-70 family RNA polymerase sigma factor [Planctomycetia bacterium]
MARHPLGTVLRRVRQLLAPVDERSISDRQLLERFVEGHDESAFEALVQRHGPMVLGVCRRVLPEAHDADDAFQATFLVLVRKAGSLPWRETIAPWLWQVAHRVALKARAHAVRRRQSEREAGAMAASEVQAEATGEADRRELRGVLDQELQKLPDKYRAPLVLCYLEGKTHQEAAVELGWPRGSMAKRVLRAEELLRERLLGRGVALSAGLAALLATERAATAALPAALLADTLRLAGDGAVPVASQVTYLAEGVIQTMNLSKWKFVAAALVVLGLLGSSFGMLWQPGQAADPVKEKRPVDPAQVKADKAAVVQGNTAFALDLYGKLRTQEGNLFLSPYSISTALAMTSAGARENTLTQMEKTLRFPVEQDRLHPAFGLLQGETKPGKGYQLSVANALWCQVNFPIRDEFLKTNEEHYGGKPVGVDFAKSTEEARRTINGWVEQRTQDKIKELIKPGILDNRTRVVLTNAIYFKGDWASPFKKDATRDAPFLSAGNKVNVPLMVQSGEFPTLHAADFDALELPYAGKELSMVIFLPKKVDGLADFEKSLTAEKLQGWLGKLRSEQLLVSLPRFQVTVDLRLDETLKGLGMSDAFLPGAANFAGVNGKASDLYIAAVVHKAFVEVNEEGTEAAAATAVVERSRGLPPQFRADHPFFFLIRDQRTGSILFMGRLVEPK